MIYTKGGKPLLQVCIENETTVGDKTKWDLKILMKLLLHEGFDPNQYDIDQKCCMLTHSYKMKKHLAFKMLMESERIDPNRVN